VKKSISIIIFLASLLFSYRTSAAQADPCINGQHEASCFNSFIHPANCQTDYDVHFDVSPEASAFDLQDDETFHHKVKVADLNDQIFAVRSVREIRIFNHPAHFLQRSSREIFRLNCTLRL
jgi:hypothetical protein